jgi:hypothetical protein
MSSLIMVILFAYGQDKLRQIVNYNDVSYTEQRASVAYNDTLDLGSTGIDFWFAIYNTGQSELDKSLVDERTFSVKAKLIEVRYAEAEEEVLQVIELKPNTEEKVVE